MSFDDFFRRDRHDPVYWVAERSIRVPLVMIAAALALAREVTSFFVIGDDALDGPLGDPDSGCDFTQSDLRLLRNANQNVGVAVRYASIILPRWAGAIHK